MDDWRPERHFRRNLAAVACWETFWGFGAACVSASIVMAFLVQLTDSKALIGSLSLTNLLGLPALFVTVYLNRRLRQKRRFAAALWAAQTLSWVVLGAGVALSDGSAAAPLIVLLFAAHATIYVTNGLVTAPTYELLARVFGRRWGTAQGVQVFSNRATGMLGGLFAAAVLEAYPFPLNFGLTFLVGGILLTLSNASLLAMAEPPTYGDEKPPRFGAYLRDLANAVAGHRAFVEFLWVIGLLAFIAMAQGFYVVYALEHLRLAPSYAGLFTTIAFAANGLGGIVAGPLGDRVGHRRLLLGGLGFHLASLVGILATRDLLEFSVALALSGVATVAASIATANLTADFAPLGEKGSYTAVTRLVAQPATALSTLLGGILIDLTGYGAVFTAALSLPLLAIALTLRFRDPRAAPRSDAA